MRLAFDLDGVLADLRTPYMAVARELFPDLPAETASADDEPDGVVRDEDEPHPQVSGDALTPRQSEQVWRELTSRRDFWESLKELEPGMIKRLATLADARRWDVLFITSRPPSAGRTVQRQSQLWLEQHGFPMPSVYVVHGSRGRVADALALDLVVDDRPEHCLDVVLESKAGAVLVWRGGKRMPQRAERLGIAVASSVALCLDTLSAVERPEGEGLLERLRRLFGLKATSRGFGRA